MPRLLWEIHGACPTLYSVWLVYVVGFLVAALFAVTVFDHTGSLWRSAVAGIVLFDIAGGAVANMTEETSAHYSGRPRERAVFRSLHVLQPGVMAFVLPAVWVGFLGVAVYTVAASWALEFVDGADVQRTLAGVCLVIGLAVLLALYPRLETASLLLIGFSALFMVKLLLGFSVRRGWLA
jgi:hypothetical protein